MKISDSRAEGMPNYLPFH